MNNYGDPYKPNYIQTADCGEDVQQKIDIHSLTPASWGPPSRRPKDHNKQVNDMSNVSWARLAPTKEGFQTYTRASTATRWGMSDRLPKDPSGRTLDRRRGDPARPLLAQVHPFNDSQIRQDLVYETLGDMVDPVDPGKIWG